MGFYLLVHITRFKSVNWARSYDGVGKTRGPKTSLKARKSAIRATRSSPLFEVERVRPIPFIEVRSAEFATRDRQRAVERMKQADCFVQTTNIACCDQS